MRNGLFVIVCNLHRLGEVEQRNGQDLLQHQVRSRGFYVKSSVRARSSERFYLMQINIITHHYFRGILFRGEELDMLIQKGLNHLEAKQLIVHHQIEILVVRVDDTQGKGITNRGKAVRANLNVYNLAKARKKGRRWTQSNLQFRLGGTCQEKTS
jgi:hypothetical protein